MSNFFRSWIIITVLGALFPAYSFATMYTFVDHRGVIHFSNVPNDSRYVKINTLKPLRIRTAPVRHVTPRDYEPYIRYASERYQVDPLLIQAVIKAESNFDSQALSCKGAQGLMQLMPGTAKDMRVTDPFDPRENISGGTRYLRKMLNIFDEDLHLALAAYNAGPQLVKSVGRIPDIPETVEYVKKVLRHYRSYQVTSPAGKGG